MRVEQDGEDVDDRWELHASDRALLGNKTGATRLGFAVLLKMFQANGRFPYRLEEVPVAAVEAIASQIEVPAEVWRGYDWRSRAAAYHRAQIRDALGFREPTLDDTDALARWLKGQLSALEHRPDRLLMAVRERCRSLRIEPPSPDRLDRLVRSVIHRHEGAWCDGLVARLPSEAPAGLDALLKAPHSDAASGKDNRAPLLALRAGAGHASLQSVGEEADKLTCIRALLLPADLFADLPAKVLLAQLDMTARLPLDPPMSADLRERVIGAVNAGISRRGASAAFKVSVSSAIRWAQRFQETGGWQVKPTGGDRRSQAIEAHKDWLLALVAKQPDLTLMEIRGRLAADKTFAASISALWRFFDRHGISFKKTLHAAEQDREDVKAAREEWRERRCPVSSTGVLRV